MKRARIAIAALFLALSAGQAWCQEAPPGPIHPRADAPPEKIPAEELRKRAIRSRAIEVIAPVSVLDPKGEMILSLTKDKFHIYDNGVEQKIDHFDLGAESLSIVFVVETSSHIEPMFPAVKHSGIVFAQAVMGMTAEVAVVGYDDSVDLLQKFTTDSDHTQSTINHLRMGTFGSRLYDAMQRGVSLLEQRPTAQRRIMVVVGEAQDTGSESKFGEVLRTAQLANVTIYSIGLSTAMADLRAKPQEKPTLGPPGTYPIPTPNGQPQTPDLERQMQEAGDLGALAIWLIKTGKNAIGPNSLGVASKATGGLHVNVKKDGSIEKAMDAIGGEIHAQYTLGYQPSKDVPYGYHEIKVVVDRPGVTVRTRPGYYLAPPES
ncbi:MAG TPA: VWA domain-containing protein [Candidatus Limnocylindria bacterium]|nr:VWA domain-containing protein [Candidatus Limnocylindria bacterium]